MRPTEVRCAACGSRCRRLLVPQIEARTCERSVGVIRSRRRLSGVRCTAEDFVFVWTIRSRIAARGLCARTSRLREPSLPCSWTAVSGTVAKLMDDANQVATRPIGAQRLLEINSATRNSGNVLSESAGASCVSGSTKRSIPSSRPSAKPCRCNVPSIAARLPRDSAAPRRSRELWQSQLRSRATGGGNALPTWRYWAVFFPANCQSSGKP